MELLSQMPRLHLIDGASKHSCFIADMFEPRPKWDAMLAYRETMTVIQSYVEKLVTRESCPFKHLGIYIDSRGACVVATAKIEMQLCNVRSAISTLLQPLDAYEKGAQVTSRKCVEKTIRPLDALDKVRLDAWSTVSQLRPPFPKTPKPEKPTPPHTNLKEFLAACESSDSEDDGPPMLSIEDGMVEPPCPDAELSEIELAMYQAGHRLAFAKWVENVHSSSVVCMLSVGTSCGDLTYIACHREERRVQFLVAKLKQLPDLAETCTLAAELAQEGLLPQPSGSRVRKAEFLKRCQAALKVKNPLAELDVKKLPSEDQRAIALALEPGKKICSQCPNLADTALEFSLKFEVPSSACSCARFVCRCVAPDPDPCIEWYCAGCALEQRAVVCPSCKNGEALQPIHPIPYLLGSHQFLNARCTKCSRSTIAPSSSGYKRKYNETLAGFRPCTDLRGRAVVDGRTVRRALSYGGPGGSRDAAGDEWRWCGGDSGDDI